MGALVVLVEHAKELIELKNLGAASVNILRAIGVSTYDDLKSMGSVQAYRRIKARGINVSKVMLYALEGALLDIHWKALEPDLKERLVEEAEAEDFSVS
ncbi:TfoX/Sxy family protein [Aurantivibrio plasticivorans]